MAGSLLFAGILGWSQEDAPAAAFYMLSIAFMVSEECSFTTGFTFDISGGRATY